MAEDDKKPDDKTPGEKAPHEPSDDKKAKSPWPSDHKAEPVVSAAPTLASATPKRAWGRPLDRLDRAWTKLDARLCAAVLLAEVLSLVFWVSINSLAKTGQAGAGLVFRCLLASIALGTLVHRLTRSRTKNHELFTAVAAVLGLAIGRLWGDAGSAYFSNFLAWMQNASFLVLFGGIGELAKRLTLWLALLGASVATAQGKHINVDVVMRFLSPKARVPVAVLGWITAAVVCFAGVWGFFDHVAVEDYRAQTSVPCPGNPAKQCDAPPSSKIDRVTHDSMNDLFIARKQLSLDLRTLPKVIGGASYAKTMNGREWNEWVREGGWESHFAADDVKGLLMSEDQLDTMRTPAVTAIPGASERVNMLLIRELNLVFSFGLLVIGLRFILRTLLAISGWVKVDPDAAHGDEDLEAHGPDGATAPGTAGDPRTAEAQR